MRLNSSEILSAISQKPIGSGTEATTYDAGSYVVRVPHTVKIDTAFRDKLSSGAYRYMRAARSRGVKCAEQLKLKPRALEVLKSDAARKLYESNYQNIALQSHSK